MGRPAAGILLSVVVWHVPGKQQGPQMRVLLARPAVTTLPYLAIGVARHGCLASVVLAVILLRPFVALSVVVAIADNQQRNLVVLPLIFIVIIFVFVVFITVLLVLVPAQVVYQVDAKHFQQGLLGSGIIHQGFHVDRYDLWNIVLYAYYVNWKDSALWWAQSSVQRLLRFFFVFIHCSQRFIRLHAGVCSRT